MATSRGRFMPRTGSTPRQRRSRERRATLMRAAEESFSANGWRATSVERIASAAGTSVGTVYTRFGSKRDLLIEVVAERVEEMTALVKAADMAGDPLGSLQRSMETAVQRRRAAAGLLRAWADACVDHPELGELEARIRNELLAHLRTTLESFDGLPGRRPEADSDKLAIVICGLIEGLHQPTWSLLSDEEAAEMLTRIILHLSLRDDALPPPDIPSIPPREQ